jgi:hypothetical protein
MLGVAMMQDRVKAMDVDGMRRAVDLQQLHPSAFQNG